MILRRVDRFSVIDRAWEGETVAIIGGGPSLEREHVELVRGLRCIAVNASYLWADFADVCHFADSHFWRWHTDGVDVMDMDAVEVRERFASFRGQKCSVAGAGNNIADEAVHIVKGRESWGLSRDPGVLVTGRNSGFQALNMAILAGASRILLLGFDGAPVDGRSHWHGGHQRPTPDAAYPLYVEAMRKAKRDIDQLGVEVINCSMTSAIRTFPRMRIEDAICQA